MLLFFDPVMAIPIFAGTFEQDQTTATLKKEGMKKTLLFLALLWTTITARSQHSTLPFSIGVTDSLYSGALGENRQLNIYLPPSFGKDTSLRYPVIYLLDGSADEDFIHVAGLVQFFNFPWVNRFPESIVVGIVNTLRKKDFTYAVDNLDFLEQVGYTPEHFPQYGGSATFIAFIEKELQPFIRQHYKANDSRTLIGQSLGGLLATEILLQHTPLFDTYIILSPSLWWGKESLLDRTAGFKPGKGLKVYLAVGDEGPVMEGDARKLDNLLRQKAGNSGIYFDYLPDDDHATMGHLAIYHAFKKLYPANKK